MIIYTLNITYLYFSFGAFLYSLSYVIFEKVNFLKLYHCDLALNLYLLITINNEHILLISKDIKHAREFPIF